VSDPSDEPFREKGGESKASDEPFRERGGESEGRGEGRGERERRGARKERGRERGGRPSTRQRSGFIPLSTPLITQHNTYVETCVMREHVR